MESPLNKYIMENLPAEVLEIVLHPLSKKKDIEKCFNVNTKWRHIIENMFQYKSTTILNNCIANTYVSFVYNLGLCTSRYIFSSNHNVHKSILGLSFWVPDPLIDRVYQINLRVWSPKTKTIQTFMNAVI